MNLNTKIDTKIVKNQIENCKFDIKNVQKFIQNNFIFDLDDSKWKSLSKINFRNGMDKLIEDFDKTVFELDAAMNIIDTVEKINNIELEYDSVKNTNINLQSEENLSFINNNEEMIEKLKKDLINRLG